MTLYLFLIASLVIHISLQYILIPRLEAKEKVGPKKLKHSVTLAVLRYLSTTALLVSATYILIVVLVFVLSLTRPVTSAEFGAAITNLQWFQSKYKIFRDFWTLWLFLMLLLAWLAYRRVKTEGSKDSEKARGEHRAVAEEPAPSLPPNEEMEDLMRKISECAQKAKRLEQSWVRSDQELAIRQGELHAEIEKLRIEFRNADLRRRTSFVPPVEEAKEAESNSQLPRFFASKGFLRTLEGTSRSLGYVGTVLLVLSVIGVNVPVLDRALANRVLHLNELQVELNRNEAQRSFAKVMAEERDNGGQQITQEDSRVIEEVAHLFEQFFTSSNDLQKEKDDDNNHVPFLTRSGSVRDHIVMEFRAKPPGPFNPTDDGPRVGPKGPNDKGPNGPKPSGPSGPGNDTGGGEPPRGSGGDPGRDLGEKPTGPSSPKDGTNADLRSRLARDDAPQSKLGEQFAHALKRGVAGRPSLLEKLRVKFRAYKASFREPAEPLDIGKFAFGEAVGSAVDNSWQAPNEVAGQLKKVGQTAFKDMAKRLFEQAAHGGNITFEGSVGRMYQIRVSKFFTDIAGESDLGDALKHVRDGLPNEPVLTNEEIKALRVVVRELPRKEQLFTELVDSYQKKPPALAYNEAELAENEKAAQELRKTRGAGAQDLSSEELKLVDSYEDHYPGRLGSEADTPKGRLLAANGKVRNYFDSEKLLTQSRDFSSLKQSVDVGGILMGRSPETTSNAGDFRDVRWTTNGESMMIFVRRADGLEVSAGPFASSLVHQALAYVADNRKVVVTIISGGEGRRRVMLHPALVDTPLGQDIIEFDKLVFRFVNRCDRTRNQSDKLISAQLLLYELALNLRKLALLKQWQSEGRLTSAGLKDLSAYAAWEGRVFRNQKIYEAVRPALAESEGLEQPEKSILARGKAFFDPALVKDVRTCAYHSNNDFSSFHQCLSSVLSLSSEPTSEEKVKLWWQPSPTLAWRSIAEELPYQADANLSFLTRVDSADPVEALWPFQFRYEIAFPVNALYGSPPANSDAYRTPWEFTGLRDLIAKKVHGGIQSNAELPSLYQRVRDFTLLQRLFRTSLEGGLGERFPIEKLVILTRVTAGNLGPGKTSRWDPQPPPQPCD